MKKGISLIVLSITILVMAILAATVIISLEDSGIIGRSKNTIVKQNQQEEYTRLQVIKNGILTDNLGEITVDEYITELQNKGIVEPGVTTKADGSKSVISKSGLRVNIMQDGDDNIIISFETETGNDAEVDMVTFYINGVQYQAELDMTWGEWIVSKYTNGLEIKKNDAGNIQIYIYVGDGYYWRSVYREDLTVLNYDEKIEAGNYGDIGYID